MFRRCSGPLPPLVPDSQVLKHAETVQRDGESEEKPRINETPALFVPEVTEVTEQVTQHARRTGTLGGLGAEATHRPGRSLAASPMLCVYLSDGPYSPLSSAPGCRSVWGRRPHSGSGEKPP